MILLICLNTFQSRIQKATTEFGSFAFYFVLSRCKRQQSRGLNLLQYDEDDEEEDEEEEFFEDVQED